MSSNNNGSNPTYIYRNEENIDDDNPSIGIDDFDSQDLQALAREVYALLRRELRLENERQGWHKTWRG